VTRFPDVGALKEQISRDVTAARALLAAGLPLRQTP